MMEEVAQTDPNNPELYYNLGVSAMQIGETERAKSYYTKALELIQPIHLLKLMASIITKEKAILLKK